jgi:hypothetical protein
MVGQRFHARFYSDGAAPGIYVSLPASVRL